MKLSELIYGWDFNECTKALKKDQNLTNVELL